MRAAWCSAARTPPWSSRKTRSTRSCTPPGWNKRGDIGFASLSRRSRAVNNFVWSTGVELDYELLVAENRDLGAGPDAQEGGAQVLESRRQVGRGRAVQVGAGRGDLERRLRPAALAHLHHLARLEPEARPVHLPAVHREVAVHDELAGLVDGAGQAGPVHHAVQPPLQQAHHVSAGLALAAVGILVRPAHLGLADVVLVPQALLLQQPDLVVRALAPAAPVHARRERPLLEVLHALGGQRDAERTGQLGLGTRVVHE